MQGTAAPDVGQVAPDFRLEGPAGQFVTLSEFRGRKHVVLVFYPLAFSPVCSTQLPEIQKDLSRFQALNAEVLGISVDSHFANETFARKLVAYRDVSPAPADAAEIPSDVRVLERLP